MGMSKGHRAVRWNAAGSATELGHLGASTAGITNSEAWAINEAGVAVGYATRFDATGLNDGPRAVRWNTSAVGAIELQVLGTDANGGTSSKAYMLNEAGTAVGWATKYVAGAAQGARAVTWNAVGQVTELGLLPGANSSMAFDVNNAGISVGTIATPTLNTAAYWNANGSAVDLNTLIATGSGWQFERALAISDTGWIAGIGKFDDGPGGTPAPYDRVFMLQVPVAVTLAGDYNASGKVDAADYVLWRDKLGTLTTVPNDTTPGWLAPGDYNVWRTNYGRTAGAGATVEAASIPEPSMLVLAMIGVLAFAPGRSLRLSTAAR
jgi:hypothetical protein